MKASTNEDSPLPYDSVVLWPRYVEIAMGVIWGLLVRFRAKNNGRSTINDRTKIDNDRPTSDPTDHFDRSNFYRHIVGSNTV